ncbi:uncharacterized protein [Elaeis guineensis]|uniref:uncharacterized protein n=1 Tax=Elaeis guineensis var. tenera TaxID=51953 RepID=UPI003C6D44E9
MMAGLFAFSVAGLGFLLVAALESLFPVLSPSSLLPLRFLSVATLSFLAILSSLISSLSSRDPLSPALPLSSLAAAALFLLYSLAGLLSLPPAHLLPLPPSLLDLLCLSAFAQEFLLFYLRRKDLDGIENRYFDLLLAPIFLCAASTLLALARPRSLAPRLARAAGLALHGTWLLQMGFSFFTSLIAHGCSLHERSWANYTIKCKTHMDYHRGRAIATLQFNCHLALLVLAGVGAYAAVVRKMGGGVQQGYRPLNKELQMSDVPSQFTLESDDDEEGEIAEEVNGTKWGDVVLPVTSEANGVAAGGSH